MVTFDGPNLLITLEAAVNSVDAQIDLYSDWKEWFKTPGNEVHYFAFSTEAGNPTSPTQNLAPAFFLRNDLGWRIKPPEEDIEISIVGNLYQQDVTLPMFIPTTGAFTVLVTFDRSINAVVLAAAAAGMTVQQYLTLRNTGRK